MEKYFAPIVLIAGGFISLVIFINSGSTSSLIIALCFIVAGAISVQFSVTAKEKAEKAERIRIEQERLEKERMERLHAKEVELREKTNLPVPDGSLSDEDSQFVDGLIQSFDQNKANIDGFRSKVSSGIAPTDEEKSLYRNSLFGIADEKLSLFYKIILRNECNKLQVDHNPYEENLQNAIASDKILLLRSWEDEQDVLHNIPTKELIEIEKLSRANLCEGMQGQLEKLETIIEEKVIEFVFINVDKAEDKTRRMKSILRKVEDQVEEVKDWCTKINELLNLSRIEAYKNLFLGYELLNLISSESEENSQTVELSQINLDGLDVSDLSFSVKEFESSFNGATRALLGTTASLSLFRGSRAATVGGLAVMAIAVARNMDKKLEIIGQHHDLQEAIITYVKDIIPILESVIAQRKQALDVIASIAQANMGFMAVYMPLRDSVFIEKKSPKQIPNILEQTNQLKAIMQIFDKICSKKV